MRRGWGRAIRSAWRRDSFERPNGSFQVLQEGSCKGGASPQCCVMRGWDNTHKLKWESFQLNMRTTQVKLWKRLPREVVLTRSLGFSRPDRRKALSNVESDLTAEHALSRDWMKDSMRCFPPWITMWIPLKRGKEKKNMLESISVGNRLTSGSSGLQDSSENAWKLNSSSEAVKRYQTPVMKKVKWAGRSEDCLPLRWGF